MSTFSAAVHIDTEDDLDTEVVHLAVSLLAIERQIAHVLSQLGSPSLTEPEWGLSVPPSSLHGYYQRLHTLRMSCVHRLEPFVPTEALHHAQRTLRFTHTLQDSPDTVGTAHLRYAASVGMAYRLVAHVTREAHAYYQRTRAGDAPADFAAFVAWWPDHYVHSSAIYGRIEEYLHKHLPCEDEFYDTAAQRVATALASWWEPDAPARPRHVTVPSHSSAHLRYPRVEPTAAEGTLVRSYSDVPSDVAHIVTCLLAADRYIATTLRSRQTSLHDLVLFGSDTPCPSWDGVDAPQEAHTAYTQVSRYRAECVALLEAHLPASLIRRATHTLRTSPEAEALGGIDHDRLAAAVSEGLAYRLAGQVARVAYNYYHWPHTVEVPADFDEFISWWAGHYPRSGAVFVVRDAIFPADADGTVPTTWCSQAAAWVAVDQRIG